MTISPLSTIIVVAFLLKLLRFPFPPPLAEAGGALPFKVGRGRAGEGVGSEEEEGGTVWLDDIRISGYWGGGVSLTTVSGLVDTT